MGAIVKNTLTIKDAEGKEFTITDRDNIIAQVTDVEVYCDSPRHEARYGNRLPLIWNENEAQKSVASLPDGFFSLIKIHPNPLDEKIVVVFCGPGCARDWLQYAYVPPLTAKAVLAKAQEGLQVTAEAQAAIEAANPQMKLPFPEKANVETNN